MGLTTELAVEVGLAVKNIGSLELIESKDTKEFLKVVRDRHLAVLGIEGFRIEAGKVIPDIGAVADFSGLPFDDELGEATVEEASRFLLKVSRPDMFFDFLLDENE